ncbi:MAG: CBS domain-containing protein [Chitinophagaceae bacterium]
MTVGQLIQKSFPTVTLNDKVYFALQLMDDYDLQHLPIVNDKLFVGLIGKNELLDFPEGNVIATASECFLGFSALEGHFFLEALQKLSENELSILPVIDSQNNYLGAVSTQQLLQSLNKHLGNNDRGAIIVLEIEPRHYSFGEISRLVETNNAFITQLNTYLDTNTGLMIVTLKVNKIEVSDLIATFQRYEYNVKNYWGEEQYVNELKLNYDHLMAYLNI